MRRLGLTMTLAAGLAVLYGCGDDDEVEVRIEEVDDVHVCTLDCDDHVYDGDDLILLRHHHHDENCGHVWRNDRWVVVERKPSLRVHVCTADCHDHLYRDGRVVVLRGHRHGPGCGHVFGDGHWVVVSGRSRVTIKRGHVCTRSCYDHVYRNDRLVVVRGHRHGPGCGHSFSSGRWVVVRSPARTTVVRSPTQRTVVRGHVCTRDCYDHVYRGGRLVVLKGHRHGRGCGHTWSGSRWVVRRP